MSTRRELPDMVIHPSILPTRTVTPQVDTEQFWPPVSARYNLSLRNIADDVWVREAFQNADDVYPRIDAYVRALVYADSLFGEDILSLLLSINRGEAMQAMVMAMGVPPEHCMGIDGSALEATFMRMVGNGKPVQYLATCHLASVLIHWSWMAIDVSSAMEKMMALTDTIDLLMVRTKQNFPPRRFTACMREEFNPHYPHPIRDLAHDQKAFR